MYFLFNNDTTFNIIFLDFSYSEDGDERNDHLIIIHLLILCKIY